MSAELKAVTWIACGAADAEEIRRVIVHNRGVRVETLFDERGAARALPAPARAASRSGRPGSRTSGSASIEREAVTRLAARDELRQRWAVTIVADHIYVDSDGVKVDSPITRFAVPPFSA